MSEEFNMSMRKFLKQVGVTSQQAIEEAMREGDLRKDDPVICARLMAATQQVYISAWVEAGMVDDATSLALRIEEQLRRSLFRSAS